MSTGLFKLRPRGAEQAITTFEVQKAYGTPPVRFYSGKGERLNSLEDDFVQHHIPQDTAVMAMVARSIVEVQTHANRHTYDIPIAKGNRLTYKIFVLEDGITTNGHYFNSEIPTKLPLPPAWDSLMGLEAVIYSQSQFESDAYLVSLMQELGWLN